MFGRSQPTSPFSSIPLTLNSKALTYPFNLLCYQWEGPLREALSPSRREKGNACHLALVSFGRTGGKSPLG